MKCLAICTFYGLGSFQSKRKGNWIKFLVGSLGNKYEF